MESVEAPPDTTCRKHELLETVLITLWDKRAGEYQVRMCPECIVRHGWDDHPMTWDGTTWRPDKDLGLWRSDWCRQTHHDARAGEQRWLEIGASPLMADWRLELGRRSTWALVMWNPEVDVDRALRLVRAIALLGFGHLPSSTPVADLERLEEESHQRWVAYQAALWARLDDTQRASVIALGSPHGARADRVPAMTVREAAAFTDAVDSARSEVTLHHGDEEIWSGDASASGGLTPRRISDLYSWVISHRVPVPSPSPPVRLEPEGRFGPNTPAVEEFLSSSDDLDDVDRACLHVCTLRSGGLRGGDPDGHLVDEARRRTVSRLFEILLEPVWKSLWEIAEERGWHVRMRVGSSLVRSSRVLDISDALVHRALALAADGLADPDDLDAVSRPYLRAMGAAERIKAGGHIACTIAIHEAPGWRSGLSELERLALAGGRPDDPSGEPV